MCACAIGRQDGDEYGDRHKDTDIDTDTKGQRHTGHQTQGTQDTRHKTRVIIGESIHKRHV